METDRPVWRIAVDDVPALVEAILNPTRLHSLVLVSPAGDTSQPRIDVNTLVSNVGNLPTDVVVLESMAVSERLSDSISEAFHCYGGSVRVVMPQARVTDHFRRHPLLLIYPKDDPRLSLRGIVEAAERTRLSPPLPPAPPPPVADPSQPAPKPGPRLARAPQQEPSPAPRPEVATRGVPAPQATDATPPPPQHTPFGLADIEAVVARAVARTLEEQLGGPSSETQRERSRADTAEELLAEAQRRSRSLEQQLDERAASSTLPQVFDDPEQLQWEVETRWLMSMPEQQRQQFTMLPWSIGDDFLTCLAQPLVPRRKTIDVMLAILRGRGWEECTTHQFLESKAGKPRQSPDGTAVWRTYVKTESPQAPRLTWWQRPDTSVVFDHVGAHDALL